MQVSISLPGPLVEIPEFTKRIEALGYDMHVFNETSFDPFTRMAVSALHSENATLTTAVALAFPRSPYVLAQMAWEIQRASKGRLLLGLGTQVKGHMERRFSIPWAPPGPRMREYVECLRAIWKTWQTGEINMYEGEYYQFQRMNPTSDPGPIDHPEIPILLSAVNPWMARLSGEAGQGIVMHGFSTPQYTSEVIIPAVIEGANRAGRSLKDIYIRGGGGFIATGKTEEEVHKVREWVRTRVAYYGSTRSYHKVLATHGWDDLGAELHRLSMNYSWDEMTALITDDILDEFVVSGTWDELPAVLRDRYSGIATDISFAPDIQNIDDVEQIAEVIAEIKEIPTFADVNG
ncbi:MAG: TIGR03617 family F420-dependent LLM class oxidoreductase [Dehalococcoidia bacterium]|jgi:probable F420-dependent oxidoreductase|nr:TIGR03617 family F420-dependent LLM class oxidoreductase [Dehalococcoidia bacterium]|tara:strand:+ start:21220 stop:22263 length:1044 start_codon:yes stop_codon:yes gene_type:complete